jgi:hypothetical protein
VQNDTQIKIDIKTQPKDVAKPDNAQTKPINNIAFMKGPTMFKKRDSPAAKMVKSPNPNSQKNVSDTMYKPSARASEYCQQFMERSKMMEVVKEDVWSRAVRVMTEIDEKRYLSPKTN